jgi:hypothetical protein
MNLGVLYRICNLSSAALEYLRKRYLCISKTIENEYKILIIGACGQMEPS